MLDLLVEAGRGRKMETDWVRRSWTCRQGTLRGHASEVT